MNLDFENLKKCIRTLDNSLKLLEQNDPETEVYEVYRNAVIKGFELTLETSGKLLRKVLRDYAAAPGALSRMVFKDVLRLAARHDILAPDEVRRWFSYREARNETAHDYGEGLAENVVSLVKDFLRDVEALVDTLQHIQEESQ